MPVSRIGAAALFQRFAGNLAALEVADLPFDGVGDIVGEDV
ncbi:MAG: hypothetical protein U5Q44_09910 [Dehalococcoidia bacterium]|nr:hypothetical protein [Dehalococcoidia bacterium]